MPLLERWTPIRELDLMDRRMRHFFEDLGVIPALAPAAAGVTLRITVPLPWRVTATPHSRNSW